MTLEIASTSHKKNRLNAIFGSWLIFFHVTLDCIVFDVVHSSFSSPFVSMQMCRRVEGWSMANSVFSLLYIRSIENRKTTAATTATMTTTTSKEYTTKRAQLACLPLDDGIFVYNRDVEIVAACPPICTKSFKCQLTMFRLDPCCFGCFGWLLMLTPSLPSFMFRILSFVFGGRAKWINVLSIIEPTFCRVFFVGRDRIYGGRGEDSH